jgi:hypothetical protein
LHNLATRLGLAAACLLGVAACGGGGRPAGPPAPVFDTLRTIEGRVAFFTTGPSTSNRDANNRLIPSQGFVFPTLPRPATRFPVEIVTPTGTVLAADITDERGDFSIQVNFGPNPATQVIVRTRARLQLPFGMVARVLANETSGEPYTNATPPSGNPDNDVMQVDLVIGLDDGAGAYYILDTLYEGLIEAGAGILATIPDLDVLWEPGNGAASSVVALSDRARIKVAGGIPGDAASNQDVWDPPVVMRLLGEMLLLYFINDVAPTGTPNDALLVPSAAWREGFLDFWACAGRGSRFFWDSEGTGASGRVVRHFDIESFYDPALGSLGPDDPNVYQDPAHRGLASRFTVAEILWDIHDEAQTANNGNDQEFVEFPLYLTLRHLETLVPGSSYPYLFTLFDLYVQEQSIDAVTLNVLLQGPEDQGIDYPPTVANGFFWPAQFIEPGGALGSVIDVGFDETLSDLIDNVNPVPLNIDIGDSSRRYFRFKTAGAADAVVTLTPQVGMTNLQVELMKRDGTLLNAGAGGFTAQNLETGTYILVVHGPSGFQQVAPFDLRLQLISP